MLLDPLGKRESEITQRVAFLRGVKAAHTNPELVDKIIEETLMCAAVSGIPFFSHSVKDLVRLGVIDAETAQRINEATHRPAIETDKAA